MSLTCVCVLFICQGKRSVTTLPHATRGFFLPTCLCITGNPIKGNNYVFIGLQSTGCDHWIRNSLKAFSDAPQEQHASTELCKKQLCLVDVRGIPRDMSVKTNLPREDVCASTPLINFGSEGVLCNVLEYDVIQMLLLFHLFISLQL